MKKKRKYLSIAQVHQLGEKSWEKRLARVIREAKARG